MTLTYELSQAADADLDAIVRYTIKEHGTARTSDYFESLHETMLMLAEQPKLGKRRKEIEAGLRSFIFEHHTIFYRAMPDKIWVARILHSRRDFPKFFL